MFLYTWQALINGTSGTMSYSNCKAQRECLLAPLAGGGSDGCGCWLTNSVSARHSCISLVCVMWFKRETSGPGSAVHHPRLEPHNSLFLGWVLTGRQTGFEQFRLLSRVSVSVGSLPSGQHWKKSVYVFWCLDALCVNICVRDPLMLVAAPGAD